MVELRLLVREPRRRSTGSLAISLGVHAAVFAIAFSIARHPTVTTITGPARENNADRIVWLPAPGPGGGGGGGGNERVEPIRKLEVQGQDNSTLPASKPPNMNPADTKPENRELDLAIPAVESGAADFTRIGVVEGIPSSDSLGLGKRDGAGSRDDGVGIGPGRDDGFGPGRYGNVGEGPYGPGNGIINPRVLHEVKPQYTAQAMRMKIQGDVLLECVVQSDGTVGQIRVVRSLDPMFGLDQEAIKAARQWRFVPAMLKGRPVAMRVTIGIAFALR